MEINTHDTLESRIFRPEREVYNRVPAFCLPHHAQLMALGSPPRQCPARLRHRPEQGRGREGRERVRQRLALKAVLTKGPRLGKLPENAVPRGMMPPVS